MIQFYNTVYKNTKRKINSIAYFNKTYKYPRPLDIGTFVLKRNILHVHFSDKLNSLRIGPFKINIKFSDITYEIVNQDGYTSHIHRNHLIPYYPKKPIVFPFIQKYNPHSTDNKTDNLQNIIELDPDADDGDFYVLTPDPLKREPPQIIKPTQNKTSITPNTFTSQDAGIY